MRLLDCKEPGCMEMYEEAPQMIKLLSDSSKRRFKALLEYLDEGNIPYFINPHLVRGLDYYTDTVFEVFVNCEDGSRVTEQKDSQEGEPVVPQSPLPIAVAGGGRYDGLLKLLGGKQTPAVGCSLGLDRIVMEMKSQNIDISRKSSPRLFLVQLGPAAKKKAFQLMEEFRKAGIAIGESVGRDSIKGQLKVAGRVDAAYALILGQREALDGTVIVREMETGIQETVLLKNIVEVVKTHLKHGKTHKTWKPDVQV